jgi:PEGA domain
VAWFGMKVIQKRRAAMRQTPVAEQPQPAAPATPAEEQSPAMPAESPAEQSAPATEEAAPAEETAPPAAAPEQTPEPAKQPVPAEAVINSEPAGAHAFVDGRPVGGTPVKVPGLKPDVTHTVKLKLDGYSDWTGTFKAGSGGSKVVSAMMKEIVFSLDISTKPPGARVLLDGWDTGRRTPTTLEALKPGKNYTVRLEQKGFAPFEEQVSSDGPGTKSIKAELVQLFGELTINTRPWAFVFVDGEKIGMTPLAGVRMTAGEHELVLANPKQELRKRLKVDIKPDETTRIVIDLGGRRP